MALGKLDLERDFSERQIHHCMSLSSHPFYQRLNDALLESRFDQKIEDACRALYAEHRGRPSIPPSVIFRMWLVGRIERITSQRGLAWRCSDSLTLREFLGVGSRDPTPDHSTLSTLKGRIPEALRESLLEKMLQIVHDRGLVRPRFRSAYRFDADVEDAAGCPDAAADAAR